LKGLVSSLNRGRQDQFLREIHPCKKRTLKSVPNIGVITGILLKIVKILEVQLSMESNFETSQEVHIREEKYKSNNRVRAKRILEYSLLSLYY
jgi:hypothetical protein